MHKHLLGIDMKALLDHLMHESGEERKFGCLSEMCSDSPYQLGALTSYIFSERMIIVANLLVDAHRIHLNDEMIDKMIILRMNKRFIERVRTKKECSYIIFSNMLSEEGASL